MDFLLKLFVEDYEKTNQAEVRERYGVVASVICILCNILLCTIKFIAGYLSKSIAIQADAFNNLSDAGSNIATLFGFKLANRQPDSDHPYGHGRFEYIVGLIISFLIILVAFSSFKEAMMKVISPTKLIFSEITLFILVISIVIKLWMAYLNDDFSKRIDSVSLKAASQDSMNDCLSTAASIISLLLYHFGNLSVDGWIGIGVSIVILKAGLDIFNDTVTPLLGQAPKKELLEDIQNFVLMYDKVIGVHDLIVHDYGPSRLFITLHAEVSSNEDMLEIHDVIDEIEREMADRFKCLATIHMDPIDISDEKTNRLRESVSNIVSSINAQYSTHDFRIVSGPTHTNLIFDIVIPVSDNVDEKVLKKQVIKEIKKIDANYYAVIQIDRAYE